MKRFIVMVLMVLMQYASGFGDTDMGSIITCSTDEAPATVHALRYQEPGTYTLILTLSSETVKELSGGSERAYLSEMAEVMRTLPEGYLINLDCTFVPAHFDGFSSLDSLKSIRFSERQAGAYDSRGYYITIYDAFTYCKNLTEVFIPSTMKRLPSFRGSPKVQFIVDKENPLYSADETGKILMSKDGTTLHRYPGHPSSITDLPPSITKIGPSAFAEFELTKINLPSRISEIGDWAFAGCTNLAEVSLPSSLTTIGSGAFALCTALTSISIPDNNNNITIGDQAFYECTALATIKFPNNESFIEIGSEAFLGCTSLTSIDIPSSVTDIGSYAFYACDNLSYVKIRNTNLGSYVFGKCPKLTEVDAPNSFKPPADTFEDGQDPRDMGT